MTRRNQKILLAGLLAGTSAVGLVAVVPADAARQRQPTVINFVTRDDSKGILNESPARCRDIGYSDFVIQDIIGNADGSSTVNVLCLNSW
jgi:hypothetical protein